MIKRTFKYRDPRRVEGIYFDLDNIKEIVLFIEGSVEILSDLSCDLHINNGEVVGAKHGDWVIKENGHVSVLSQSTVTERFE
jgi:hypothetical protein